MTAITRQAIFDYISTTNQLADDFCIDALADRVSKLHDFISKFSMEELQNFLSKKMTYDIKFKGKKDGYFLTPKEFRNYNSSQNLYEFENFAQEFEICFLEEILRELRNDGKKMIESNWKYALYHIYDWFDESAYKIKKIPESLFVYAVCERCHQCSVGNFLNCPSYKSKKKAWELGERLRLQKEKKDLLSKSIQLNADSQTSTTPQEEVKDLETSASDLKKKEKRAEKRRRQKERRCLENEEVIVFNPSLRQFEEA